MTARRVRPASITLSTVRSRTGSATVLKLLLAALGALLGLLGIGSVGGHHAAPSAVASAVLPPPPPANDTTFYLGPVQRNGATGSGNVYVDQLSIPTVAGRIYKLRIQNGTAGGANRVTSAVTKWNGYVVVEAGELTSSTAEVTEILSATPTDTLSMTVVGPAGSYVTVSVFSVTSPEFVIFGQNTYNIPSGTTKTYTPSFTKPATAAATYRMLVINGDSLGANRVTTGQIKLNGTTVFPTTELTSAKGSLSKNVTVTAGSNSLNIVLNGSTGKFIKLRITATDTTDPGVTITTPVASSFTNQTTVSVTGTLSDETITTVTVNGVDATVTGNTSYANTASLSSEGSNLLTVIATDGNANATTVTRTITRDTQAPTLTVAHPLDSTFTKNASVTVDGTVSDATVATVNTNGTPWTVSAGNYSGSFSLAYGNNTLVTTATDQATNTTSIARLVVRDTLPPSLTVSAPTNGTTTNGDSILVTGTVSDPSPVTVAGNGVNLPIVAGAFSGKVPLSVGANTINVVATDRATNSSTPVQRTVTRNLPPDPASVASPINPNVATGVQKSTEFLYSGSNPIQVGMVPGTITANRAALIRGKTVDTTGAALSGVTVGILNHPEVGTTVSRSDGKFDLVLNGGGQVAVNLVKPGYLPVQRSITVPWNDFVVMDSVALLPVTARVTQVDFTTAIQVAKGDSVADTSGVRQPVLMFRQGTQVSVTLPDGGTQAISAPVKVRATEYTVGPKGPARMPGTLPAASGYTYAVELSLDTALALNATSVQFTQPVAFYLDNFLSIPVGYNVPVGSYDRKQGKWVPETDGRVVKILSVTGGKADLQLDTLTSHVAPQSQLDSLGISDAERTQLATQYALGKTLWRSQATHFSAYDLNLIFYLLDTAVPPLHLGTRLRNHLDNPCNTGGSIIACENQTLGEVLPITGTPFQLAYQSGRMPGYGAESKIDLQLSEDTLPPGVAALKLIVTVGGRQWDSVFAPTPNKRTTFVWDGLDLYGRRVQGPQPITIQRCYAYPYLYWASIGGSGGGGSPASFGTYGVQALAGGQVFSAGGRDVYTNEKLCHKFKGTVGSWINFAGTLGSWSNPAPGLGGWSLSAAHAYDPVSQTLYLGDGTRRSAKALGNTLVVAAGVRDTGTTGDGGPATQAKIYFPDRLAVGPDGSLYISHGAVPKIRRVDPAGIITTIAGTGQMCPALQAVGCGDGGPATSAKFRDPKGMALGPDGSLYIADYNDARVRKIDPAGQITTLTGNGTAGYSGDGHRADSAQVDHPYDVAVGPDGSVYIADLTNSRIRRVAPNGTITTVAGGGSTGFMFGDGGPAVNAILNQPFAVAVAPNGTLYINDMGHRKIRKVAPNGIITTVWGDGSQCTDTFYNLCGDGGRGTAARMQDPTAIAVGPDGSLYLADGGLYRVRRLSPNGIVSTVAGTGKQACIGNNTLNCAPRVDNGVASQTPLTGADGIAANTDGTLYLAEYSDIVVRKIAPPLPGLTPTDMLIASEDGGAAYLFDGAGKHKETRDGVTGTTILTFAYDTAGRLLTVTDADANVTTIQRNASGTPTAILAPFGQKTTLTTDGNGFLATVANPGGETVRLFHRSNGLLDSLADPRNKVHKFTYDVLGQLTRDADPAGGYKDLTLTETDTTKTVVLSTQMGRITTYTTEQLKTGVTRRTIIDPAGFTTVSDVESGLTTMPDSTTVSVVQAGDPRWGLQAPMVQRMTVTLPSGLASAVRSVRRDSLSAPADPLSLVSQLDSVALNSHWTVSSYTAATRRLVETSPEGRQVFAKLDAKGRVISTQAAGLDSVRFVYDNRGRIDSVIEGGRKTKYTYSVSSGRLASIIDPLSRVTQFTYDSAGRVESQTLPDGRLIQFVYDSNGNLTSLTPPGRPPHGFQYTAVDLAKQYDPPTLPIGAKPTKYFYNLDRQVDSIVRPDSVTVAFGYDAGGRPASVRSGLDTLSFGYSVTAGNLINIRRTGGDSLKFRYDGLLPTQVIWKGTLTDSVRVHYNADFSVDSQYVHGGNVVGFTYDNDGLLKQVGGLGLKRIGTNGLLLADSLGSSATKAVKTSYAYTSRGELQGMHAARNGTALFATGYVRDTLGRITQLFDTTQGTARRWGFVYDSVGRLKADSINGTIFRAFTYDSNGNRLTYTSGGGTTNYWYDAQDRLDSTKVGAGTATKYTYASSGELRTKVTGASTTTLTYDALGNLTRVVLPSGAQIDYLIDGQNRRVGRKVNGSVTHRWVYQNQLNPVAELDGAGNVVSRFVYGARLNVPDYMVKGGNTYRIITDHLGSVRLVVDTATGAVAQRIDYDEFGVATVVSGAGFQPFGFAGGLTDDSTGLVRFGARDYDASVGRWTAKEPLGFAGGSANFYGYVGADPINLYDPTGRDWRDAAQGFAEGAATTMVAVAIGTLAPATIPIMATAGAVGLLASVYHLTTDPCITAGDWHRFLGQLAGGAVVGGVVAGLSPMGGSGSQIHGNSAASPRTAYLYRLETQEGEYLKTGISQNPFGRYSKAFLEGKTMRVLTSGSRREMLNLERFIVERDPGPLNGERWAGRFADDVP